MIDYNGYIHLLRNDFASFIHMAYGEVAPGATFLSNWHISLIAHKLEQCRLGKYKRLIINIPPRNLKSISASVAFPAWLLGHDPTCQIICASYSQDLSDKHARDTRLLTQSTAYQDAFKTRLGGQKLSVNEFTTTAGGTRYATSIGGTLTGRGADFIIIDDPLKPDEAVSESQRSNVNNWYDSTLLSRLNNKQEGCIILIMQRLHEDDLVGHLVAQGGWEVLSLPAIAEEDEVHTYEDIFGKHRISRKAGEALHPEREPLEILAEAKRTMGSYSFAGQYQQNPAPLGGGMIKTQWFKYYDVVPESFNQIIQSWDTANKVTDMSDYSVCTTWAIKHHTHYLLDVQRLKLEYPQLRRMVISQHAKWRANIILIEDKASGTQLIQDLRNDGLHCIKAIKPEGDKQTRMYTQTASLESGAVLLPETAPWLADFLHEATCFPNGRNDDQVDSLSQYLSWANEMLHDPGPRIRRL